MTYSPEQLKTAQANLRISRDLQASEPSKAGAEATSYWAKEVRKIERKLAL